MKTVVKNEVDKYFALDDRGDGIIYEGGIHRGKKYIVDKEIVCFGR